MASVHVLGSLNVDHAVRVVRHPAVGTTVRGQVTEPTPGGKGLNQAVAAALAAGVDGPAVFLHGTVGADEPGRWLVDFAASRGVEVGGVQVDGLGRTGSAWITVAGDGANTVIVDAGANQSTVFRSDMAQLSEADVVVAGLEVPEASVAGLLCAARATGARSIFNPSPVGADPERIAGLIAEASIVVLNEHELAELTAAASEPAAIVHHAETLRHGDQTVIVTLGAAGAASVGPDGTDVVAGIPVGVVDTTGAGDCFLGVLAASLAGGLALPDALRRANRAAARSTTQPGAGGAMPDAGEIDA